MSAAAATKQKASFGKRLRRVLSAAALGVVAGALVLCLAVWMGVADRWMRRAIVGQIERMTGGRVELKSFRFHWLGLSGELQDLTVHGLEPENTPPLFHADSIRLKVHVDSFFRRRVSLDELDVDRPAVHVRVEADGRSNVPAPKPAGKPTRPMRERIFELVVRRLRLHDGYAVFNDVRVPLVAEGGPFQFALDFNAPAAGKEFYLGQLSWQQTVVVRRYLPFPSDVSLKFTLERGRFTVEQLRWKLPRSEFDVRAALADFAKPEWSFRYRGRLSLDDFREILRKPNTPGGTVDFSGEGRYGAGKLSVRGGYAAHDVVMRYDWFHSAGMESRGSYMADQETLVVPDLEARALGGILRGRLDLAFHGMKFRAQTHSGGMSLAGLLAATDHRYFPVKTLHWVGSVEADSVTTWTEDFKHVESRGLSRWSPAPEPRVGEVPASARLDYYYSADDRRIVLQTSEISTPSSRLRFSGVLGARDSALAATAEVGDLEPWNDFINRVRGTDAEPRHITGRGNWQGRVGGPLSGPTFTGHVQAYETHYNGIYWNEVEGDVTYSPDELRLLRARARRGRSTAQLELWLELDEWNFYPESRWTLEANLERASTDDLQEILGWSYPVHGLLTGQFRGRGTRGDPELAGLFDIAEMDAWGYRLDRFRGQFSLRHDEFRIANAELRVTPPQGARGPGVVTGNFLYRGGDQQISFDLTGAVIPLESIQRIQSARLPLGGQLSFQLSGKGPLRAPVTQGSLRLVDLRVGKEVLGSFEGRLRSDGWRVHLDVNSAMSTGRLEGKLDLVLAGQYPLQGDATIERIDLDPFLQTAFHMGALSGHSSVDGRFTIAGELARPETVTIQADISRLALDYQNVKLQNVGPVRFSYRRDEVRIEQANLRGTDTDFRLSGFARFAGDRRLSLSLAGTVNLRLLGGWVPRLEARGPAQVNAAIEGTSSRPRINGKVRLENASAHYGDFPAGLNQLTGDFVFDTSRLLFENVTAETGGGQLSLSGTVTYGDGPFRYDLTARSARVRIRYPEGMSWLAGGTLRLTGTAQAAVLSGRVVVERLLMAQGFDLVSLIVASKEPVRAPSTSSPFLRNLQFDIEAVSSPAARVEWAGARFESEASLRARGTWEHPILLGHVHLLAGEMTFRGNRYRLTRGDINFSNPFRLDPVLNVEATTTIRQYEVTLNFTGPASKLTLAYRSDPPLPANDIITLLALGRTGEESELRSSSTQTPGAGALLSEAISSQLGGRLERLFGISRLRVDPFLTGTGTEQNAATRITIEQQVTRDLVITYSTNVSSAQYQIIQVEYNVRRNVSIIALRDQNGTFGLDIKFKKRFK